MPIIASTSARVARAVAELGEKRRVDLQRVERQLADRRQRRVAGAEAVQRDPHADAAQVVELRHRDLALAREHRLGDLEHELGRAQGRCAAARARRCPPARAPRSGARETLTCTAGALVLGRRARRSQCASSRQAIDRISAPSGTASPLASAAARNWAGASSPWSGCCQRTNASTATIVPAVQVEDRLVVQAQLAVGQRAAQPLLDLGGVQQPAAHALRRELGARAAALARADRAAAVAVRMSSPTRADAALGQHDADARGQRQLAPAGEHRLAQRRADPLGELERLAVGRRRRARARAKSSPARRPAVASAGSAPRRRAADADEHLVAGAMSRSRR